MDGWNTLDYEHPLDEIIFPDLSLAALNYTITDNGIDICGFERPTCRSITEAGPSIMATYDSCFLDVSNPTSSYDAYSIPSDVSSLNQHCTSTHKRNPLGNLLRKTSNIGHTPNPTAPKHWIDSTINLTTDTSYGSDGMLGTSSLPSPSSESQEFYQSISSNYIPLNSVLLGSINNKTPPLPLDFSTPCYIPGALPESNEQRAEQPQNDATISSSRNDLLSSTEDSTVSSPNSITFRHRKKISEAEWQRIRPYLNQLYFREGRPLRIVMQLLADEHAFQASEQLFKKRIRNWGMTRSFRASQKLRLINSLLSNVTSSNDLLDVSQDKARKLLRFAQAEHRAGRLKALEFQTIQFKLEGVLASSKLQDAYSDAIGYFCKGFQHIETRTNEISNDINSSSASNIKIVPPQQYNIERQPNSGVLDGLLHLFDDVLKTTIRSQSFSFSRLQTIEAVVDDVRIFGRLNAFSKGMELMRNFISEYKFASDSFSNWLVAFMPYLCADMWLSVELPSLLVDFTSEAVKTAMGNSHPVAQLFKYLQQRLPNAHDHSNLWTALANECAAQSPDSLDLWLCLSLQAIRYARRTNQFELCTNECLKVTNMLSSVNRLNGEQRAVLLFERARALSASGHTSHAEKLMQRTLQFATQNRIHRLTIKTDLRLAELYNRDSANVELEQKHYVSAFRRALRVFGLKSAVTMLTLSKIMEFCKREHKQATKVIPEDEYRAAFNHYVCINDLIKNDEKLEEISKQEFLYSTTLCYSQKAARTGC